MRIVSWNINSLRLRLPLLKQLIQDLDPDIICLQETKVPDHLFPLQELVKLKYPYVSFLGMKGYNGVAIISRLPIRHIDITQNWCDKEDCRHLVVQFDFLSKTFTLHNFYVPAGGDEPDPEINPKFAHKLQFLNEITNWFKQHPSPYSILVGDLNIAPLEQDVWSHKQLLKVVSHTPIETQYLNHWLKSGFIDAMRLIIPPEEKLYTWWSYRNKDWKKSNRGRRLDHIWITPDIRSYLKNITIHKAARDWPQPSDHIPIALDIDKS